MNKKDIKVIIVGPGWGGGASRKIDKKNVHAMLDNADTNTDPTPEEVKRVMSYLGKRNMKLSKKRRKARARTAGLASAEARKLTKQDNDSVS